MNRSITTIAGLCAGITLLATSAIAGPEHKEHAHADKMGDKPTLADFVDEVKLPELFIGSKAPEMQIAKFVKGDSVQQFEDGKVYVVEFWATWCGPCIAAFPHLSEQQAAYDDKVQFIGVNVWERSESQAARIEMVEEFVAEQGDRMSYTVAVEQDTAMADSWLKPAGQNGIPAAFIVDGTGNIAWVGHPMSMDEPLESIVSGDFDPADAIEDYKAQNMMMAAYQKFAESVRSGEDLGDAMAIAGILVSDHFQEEAGGLNAIAWTILSSENDEVGEKANMVAYKAIKQACEISDWENWMYLDTYALAAHKMGKNEVAVKWQKKAIDMVPDTMKERAMPDLEAALAKYEAAAEED